MVALIFTILFSSLVASANPVGELVMEYSRSRIYAGEQVQADFYLVTPLRILEVEVAKFPEFRGYWKENTMLRQGRITMVFEPAYTTRGGQIWRRVRIGSYNITPMMGEKNPQIQPMRVVVRHNASGTSIENVLHSKPFRDLKIRRLPPVPRAWRNDFHGAVGTFRLSNLRDRVKFSEGQPARVEFSLEGEGNYQEINQLTKKLDVPFEILSDWSSLSNTGSYFVKNFQWNFSIKEKKSFTLAKIPFVYFDPNLRQYKRITTSPVQFIYTPPRVAAPILEELPLPEIQKNWRPFSAIEKSTWFWAIQSLFGFFLLFFGIKNRKRTLPKPVPKPKLSHMSVVNQWNAEKPEAFLKAATAWIEQELQDSCSTTGRNRRELLKKSNLPHAWKEQAESIFSQSDQILFGPGSASQSAETIHESFQRLRQAG